MHRLFKFIVLTLSILFSATGGAQSFNVDLKGLGKAPSSFFGAAANQPGYWNAVPYARGFSLASTTLNREAFMLDVLRQPTSIRYQVPGGHLGWWNPGVFNGTSGDYATLLSDGYTGHDATTLLTFTGLEPGTYSVYTYAAPANNDGEQSSVFVEGSSSQNPQVVTGPLAGNVLIHLQTHSIHQVTTTGMIVIRVTKVSNPADFGFVSGLQFVKH